jgi:hypothetical protein
MKCKNKRCTREAHKRHTLCAPCRYKMQKTKYPVKRAYFTLRSNAQRRGKEFTLTLADFTAFCNSCNYITNKGIRSASSTVDRIDEERGYSADNIQCLTNAENRRKFAAYMRAKKQERNLAIKNTSTNNLE